MALPHKTPIRAAAATGGSAAATAGTSASLFARFAPLRDPARTKIANRSLLFFFQNMGSLLENGLSVPKALGLLAREPSLRKYNLMLEDVRKRVETGQSFSTALGAYPAAFDKLTVHEIKTAEQAGTAAETLAALASQLEYRLEIRANVIKKVSYPALTLVAGILSVVLMMLFVVPQFQTTFERADIELPLSTRTLIASAGFTKSWGWLIGLAVVGSVVGVVRARRQPDLAFRIDQAFLQIPIIGNLLRDVAVLQFVTVLSRMMSSGFKLVDALGASVESVGNHVMRSAIADLRNAVSRGEKLSVRLERYEGLFPAVIGQLVIIGEQTGNLAKATQSVRRHLARQVERKIDRLVAALEPALTLGLVVVVGTIMLAIYEPMFAMLQTIE